MEKLRRWHLSPKSGTGFGATVTISQMPASSRAAMLDAGTKGFYSSPKLKSVRLLRMGVCLRVCWSRPKCGSAAFPLINSCCGLPQLSWGRYSRVCAPGEFTDLPAGQWAPMQQVSLHPVCRRYVIQRALLWYLSVYLSIITSIFI